MSIRPTLAVCVALLAGSCFGADPKREPPAQPPAQAERPEDVKAIRALDAAFTQAFNKGDAKAVADLFTDAAELTDESGATIQGRPAIAHVFANLFAEHPGKTIELTEESLRFLGPDVAKETGRSRTVSTKGGSPEHDLYTVIFVKHNGRWLHDSVQEHSDSAVTPHERLKELEWMIGEWVDESEEGLVDSICHWSDDKNYLLRDFTVKFAGRLAMTGTQRIGWDPQTRQFRTWVFDSHGGFNEGPWTRGSDGQWLIKLSGTLADGQAVSATHVLTFVSKDMARWKSIDRTIGGRAVPDVTEVALVRKPPRPK